jgi:hypothetical protein
MPIERIEQLTTRHIEQLHALYQAEWWTQGRLRGLSKILGQTGGCGEYPASPINEARSI